MQCCAELLRCVRCWITQVSLVDKQVSYYAMLCWIAQVCDVLDYLGV